MAYLAGLTTTELQTELKARLRDRVSSTSDLDDALNNAMRVICQIGTYSFLQEEQSLSFDKTNQEASNLYYVDISAFSSKMDEGKKTTLSINKRDIIQMSRTKLLASRSALFVNSPPSHYCLSIKDNRVYINGTLAQNVTGYFCYTALPTKLGDTPGSVESDLPPAWATLVVDVAEYEQKRKHRTIDADKSRIVALERMKLFVREFAVDAEDININDLFTAEGH